MKSPFIKKQICGRVEVEEQEDGFKDVKLFPGGSREWEWAETSNHHSPRQRINIVYYNHIDNLNQFTNLS